MKWLSLTVAVIALGICNSASALDWIRGPHAVSYGSSVITKTNFGGPVQHSSPIQHGYHGGGCFITRCFNAQDPDHLSPSPIGGLSPTSRCLEMPNNRAPTSE